MVSTLTLHPIYTLKALLNQLIARDHPTAIVCTSAGAATLILPGIISYCAAKSFVTFLSEALHYELKEHKIDIMAWEPLGITSNMMEEKPGGFTISADKAAKDIMKHVGKEKNTKGNFRHAVHFLGVSSITSYGFMKPFIRSKINAEAQKKIAEGKQDAKK
jgi:short-subunit dehydrogenase